MIDKQIYSSTERDICEHKYVKPMENHQIWFDNHIKNSAELLELIEQLLNEIINNEFAYELAVKGAIHNMLAHLFRNHINTIKSNSELKRSMLSYERLNPVFQYIENNYASEIKIENLASLTYLSTSHFSRLFKQATGKTATQYINEFRISKAEVLLKTTDLSVSDVAERVGFISSSYFAKWLKTLRNTTPTELRKMHAKT
jgi:transcriptional regulator GlxA family with amidase domain